MTTGPFAFVRSLKTNSGSNIREFAQIQSAEQHAKRGDVAAKRRQVEGRSHEANYFWSKAGEGLHGGGADYAAAFRAHKIEAGVKTERKGAALAEHLLVGVSPEWLSVNGGDPRDLANPRVVQLIEEACAWAESWMGEGAVWAVRYDTDEKGAGIVDILASPIREAKHKSGSSRPSISVRKAGAELAEKHGAANSWIAMQSDWAVWAQDRMDPALQRGIPRKETERVHVAPETYAAQVEAALAEARAAVDAERDALVKDREVLTEREEKIAEAEGKVAEAEAQIIAAMEEAIAIGDRAVKAQANLNVLEDATQKKEKRLQQAVGASQEAEQRLAALITREDELGASVTLSERRLTTIAADEDAAVARVAELEDQIEGLEAEETELRNAVHLTGDGAENFGIAMQQIDRVTAAAADMTFDADLFETAQRRAFRDDRGQPRRFAQDDAQNSLVVRFIKTGFQRAYALFERLRSLTRFNDEIRELRAAPEPLMQMHNNFRALQDAVGETLTQLGIADQRHDLGEVDETGDPPPVLELVFSRMDRKAKRLNQELTAHLGQSGPGMR